MTKIYLFSILFAVFCMADGFAPLAAGCTRSTALSMGIFDSFKNAFANEEVSANENVSNRPHGQL